MNKFRNALWGLVFIVIGIIIGLNALNITDINIFFKGWWTLFIIIPCFIGLFKSNERVGNLIGLCIGIVLLLAIRGYVDMSIIMKLIIPFILIAVGLSLIFNNIITSSISKKIRSVDKNGLESFAATFSEQKVDKSNEEFKGANLDAVFGAVTLNLQQAIINSDVVINSSAIFGGITIIAPRNINIKLKSVPIFGGVSNKIINSKDENIKTIYIDSFCLFGGVDIK